MSARFLFDEQLPQTLARWLASRSGSEIKHVFEVGLGNTADGRIAAWAAQHGFAIVTKDEDYSAYALRGVVRVIWLRCGNLSRRRLTPWLLERWEDATQRCADGEQLIEVR